MRRIRNLKRVTALVIVLTVSVAIGVAAWRASAGPQQSRQHQNQGHEIERKAGSDHQRHEH